MLFGQPKQKLPSLSYATSVGRGPQRPYLTGVGDRPRYDGSRSYSLARESGKTDLARWSRGGTLNARNVDGENGGTLVARARSGVPLLPRGATVKKME